MVAFVYRRQLEQMKHDGMTRSAGASLPYAFLLSARLPSSSYHRTPFNGRCSHVKEQLIALLLLPEHAADLKAARERHQQETRDLQSALLTAQSIANTWRSHRTDKVCGGTRETCLLKSLSF